MELIRILTNADWPALDAFLRPRLASSMFLAGNSRQAGLEYTGQRYSAAYAASFDGGTVTAVVAHCWNGNLVLQAPVHLETLLHAAATATGLAILGVLGPAEQVAQARDLLALPDPLVQVDDVEGLYRLLLDELQVPEGLRSGRLVARRIESRDLELQTAWRLAYSVESLGEHDTPEAWSDCRQQVERLIASHQAWILEDGGRPVATSALNSIFEDLVQIGGVYTPPALRSRGYGRAVVAGSLLDLEVQGVRQAILFTGDANLPAQKAYLALGFRRIGDFRMILLREGFWSRRGADAVPAEVPPNHLRPLRFIAEPIEVEFDQPPVFAKRPGCPDRFTWEGRAFQVAEMLREWQDTGRRGRMASNMRPEHLATASRRGSWGVGRTYFRVRTDLGRVFDLYYDRAPKHVGDRLGHWYLYRELG